MDAQKLAQLAQLAQELGADTEVSREEAEAYFPNVESDFYVPQKHTRPGFDAKGLRGMNYPDSGIFRRLLGIK